MLAIAVQRRLHLHNICATAAGAPACVERQPHLQAAASARTRCTARRGKSRRGKSQLFKSNDGETLTQIRTTWKGPSVISVLQKVTGTGLHQRQIGNNPTNFMDNVPFAPDNIPPNS